MASWSQLEFNDAISPIIKDFIFFHDHVMIILVYILSFVGYMIITRFFNTSIDVNLLENQSLEVIWTLLPVFILLYVGAPSLYILYRMDYEFISLKDKDFFRVKVIGHQWYWSYAVDKPAAIVDGETGRFDSYIVPSADLQLGEARLLEVDNQLSLPCATMVKFYVTAADVLHSWTVPSLGLKIDACPGRLNQVLTYVLHPGVFYGQCSEICGANHSFMPICVEAINISPKGLS